MADVDVHAIGFPLHLRDRETLRIIAGLPLPAIVPGSTAAPCTRCGMTLAVGPRAMAMVTAGQAVLYCLLCSITVSKAEGRAVETRDLGNPDSRLE